MTDRVVVLGSGYAGVTAIQRLESDDEADIDIVWISDQGYHFVLHSSHKLITEPDRRENLTVSNTNIADESTRVVEARVDDIESDSERVVLSDGRKIAYDHLVIGIGSRTATYNIPGIIDYGKTLKSRRDVMQIATAVREHTLNSSYENPATIVVGGAGLSGIQVAGEIAQFRDNHGAALDIHLVEALDEIFPNAPAKLQHKIRSKLTDKGVHIHTNDPIERIDENEILSENHIFDYDLFVWTGGITGPPELANSTIPTDKHGRAQVKPTLETQEDNVYAVGDAAIVETQSIQPTAQAARQAGKVAGENILRRVNGVKQADWEYTDRGTLISIGDDVIAHGVPYSPVKTFSGMPAKTLKKSVTEAWIKSLNGPVSFFELLPEPMKGESPMSNLPF